MYNIGDCVVYPMHGAGVIESIEEKKFLSEKQKYYVMKMPIGDMKVMIPVNNIQEIGIRDVIDTETAQSVLTAFEEMTPDMNANWNKRYRENMLRIKSGEILEVASVVKSLMIREKMKGLSTGERKMLSTSRQILVSELVLAKIGIADDLISDLSDIIEKYMAENDMMPDGKVVNIGIIDSQEKVLDSGVISTEDELISEGIVTLDAVLSGDIEE